MRANGKYAEIARKSLKENQPEAHAALEASGQLEPMLAEKDKVASDSIDRLHQQNLRAGMQPAEAHMNAESSVIRDQLLAPTKEEQQAAAQGGYLDHAPTNSPTGQAQTSASTGPQRLGLGASRKSIART